MRGQAPMITLPRSEYLEDICFATTTIIYMCKKGWVEKEVCARASPLLLLLAVVSCRGIRA